MFCVHRLTHFTPAWWLSKELLAGGVTGIGREAFANGAELARGPIEQNPNSRCIEERFTA
ncbi:MAG: hypothetical protein AMS18_13480 [Gemmatimonas sp. SG8_17]|nr:MAG: hypothetical protein AMS18_13480 [Gemmatimonas sp. SG8_17]